MKISNLQINAFSKIRHERNNTEATKALEKLSTGIRINKAADDASGSALTETMKAQIRGLSQAQRNMQDGYSVLEVTDEGLQHVTKLLQRARELSIQSGNDTLSSSDREAVQIELDQIKISINDTAEMLEFNTKKILGENAPLVLMVGANPGQLLTIDLVDVSTDTLNITSINYFTRENSMEALKHLDNALTKVHSDLTKIGSYYETLQHQMLNASNYENNLTEAFSKINDSNIVTEMTDFISINIRQNGDQMLLSQVHKSAQDIIYLIRS